MFHAQLTIIMIIGSDDDHNDNHLFVYDYTGFIKTLCRFGLHKYPVRFV